MKFPKCFVFSSGLLLLMSCGAEEKSQTDAQINTEIESKNAYEMDPAQAKVELALLQQLRCQRPAQASLIMGGMLRQQIIAETDDGGDGVVLFVPVKPIKLLGFPVIRMGGWQSDEAGEVMPPFYRGPGTPPPNHITVTVLGSLNDVREKFSEQGIAEGGWVPDKTRAVEVLEDGTMTAPHRRTPGPIFEDGDHELTSSPVQGAVTIECSADQSDFDKDVTAQFDN